MLFLLDVRSALAPIQQAQRVLFQRPALQACFFPMDVAPIVPSDMRVLVVQLILSFVPLILFQWTLTAIQPSQQTKITLLSVKDKADFQQFLAEFLHHAQ